MVKPIPAHYQKLHRNSPVVDMHCDSILRHIEGKEDISIKTKGHLDLPKMIKGGLKAQVFAIFPDPKKIKPGGYEGFILNAVKSIKDFCRKNNSRVALALSPAGLKRIVKSRRIAIIIGVEGGHSLEANLARLFHFWRAGVRILTITWCNSNELADASWDRKKPHNGISDLGRRAIRIMNRLGMIVDVSHASEQSFYQIVASSRAPVIASHSGVYALTRHNRNLKLKQLRALKEKGGLMGQVFLPGFLHPIPKRASIEDVVRSIDYVVQRFGPDLVGLGSDFDGFSGRLKGLEDASMLPEITKRLVALGYNDDDIKKILGLNFMRVWDKVWQKRG